MDLSHVRLIACDLDGTLLDSRHRPPKDLPRLVRRLSELGVAFVPASGRQYGSIIAKLSSLQADGLTVIAENGSVVRRGAELVVESRLPGELASEALRRAQALEDVGIVVCAHDRAYVSPGQPAFVDVVREFYADRQEVHDLADVIPRAVKIALYHPRDAAADIYPSVSKLEGRLKVKVSGQHWVDLSPPSVDKGIALREVQARLAVTPDETVAIGDYHNDLEMLAAATYSFAVASAHPDVLAAARYRTGSNDEGGAASVIRQVIAARRGLTTGTP